MMFCSKLNGWNNYSINQLVDDRISIPLHKPNNQWIEKIIYSIINSFWKYKIVKNELHLNQLQQ